MAGQHLVFVAGASPQIITETVYALVRAGAAGGEISVLTTTTGRDMIDRQLFGRGGAWSRLRREYPAARGFHFPAGNVVVLADAQGALLEDVRSREDNIAAADQIVRFVADHTRDGSPPLHASIAGGRKTMGYLLAAAMMLYGRAEDRLSHVLVHPAELEGTDFFFPPHDGGKDRHRYHGPGKKVVRVGSSEIKVELAELPFPRLRALHDPAALHTQAFSSLVAQTQADLDALTHPQLVIDVAADRLICSDRLVRLRPVQFEIYRLLAKRRLLCADRGCPGCPTCWVPAVELTGSFRAELARRMRLRQSPGVHEAKWDADDFRSEVSKLNGTLQRTLRAAGRLFRISPMGERRHLLYGIPLSPEAITFAG